MSDNRPYAEPEDEPAPPAGTSGQTSGTPGESANNSASGTNTIDWAGEVETTLKAMLSLPAQVLDAVLPEESKSHFKAAGRETILAVYSLWRNIERSAKGPPEEKARSRIEVE
jgi:hypothetical protein